MTWLDSGRQRSKVKVTASRRGQILWTPYLKVTPWFKYVVAKAPTSTQGRGSPSSTFVMFFSVTGLQPTCFTNPSYHTAVLAENCLHGLGFRLDLLGSTCCSDMARRFPRYLGPLGRVDDLRNRQTLRSASPNRLVLPYHRSNCQLQYRQSITYDHCSCLWRRHFGWLSVHFPATNGTFFYSILAVHYLDITYWH